MLKYTIQSETNREQTAIAQLKGKEIKRVIKKDKYGKIPALTRWYCEGQEFKTLRELKSNFQI